MGHKKVQEVVAANHTVFIGEVISSEIDDSKRAQVLDNEVYLANP